jgi:hypothetical protein
VNKSVDRIGPRAAAAAALAATACTACCVLPLTLPPVILGSVGGFLALIDHVHGGAGWLAALSVVAAWMWIGWQVVWQKRRMRAATMALMLTATLLAGITPAWPLLEPLAHSALGLTRGAHQSG